MTIATNNVFTTACWALGVDPRANSDLVAKTAFRGALQRRNMAPFRLATTTFSFSVPAVAALNILRHFGGQTSTWVRPSVSAPIFEGFHRRGAEGGRFHSHSNDFEDRLGLITDDADSLSEDLKAAEVNPVECLQPLTLGENTTLILCGTVVDFYELTRACGPLKNNAHPEARRIAREAWEMLQRRLPQVTEVFDEVAP